MKSASITRRVGAVVVAGAATLALLAAAPSAASASGATAASASGVTAASASGATAAPASGATAAPAAKPAKQFDWTSGTVELPWKVGTFPSGTDACPTGTVTFTPLGEVNPAGGYVRTDGYYLQAEVLATADITKDGRPDQLVSFFCQVDAQLPGAWWLYVYTTVNGKPVVQDFVTTSDFVDWPVTTYEIDFRTIVARYGAVRLTMTDWNPDGSGEAQTLDRTFTWKKRTGLVPDVQLPFHPEADVAPK